MTSPSLTAAQQAAGTTALAQRMRSFLTDSPEELGTKGLRDRPGYAQNCCRSRAGAGTAGQRDVQYRTPGWTCPAAEAAARPAPVSPLSQKCEQHRPVHWGASNVPHKTSTALAPCWLEHSTGIAACQRAGAAEDALKWLTSCRSDWVASRLLLGTGWAVGESRPARIMSMSSSSKALASRSCISSSCCTTNACGAQR